MGFLGFAITFALKVAFSFALTRMVVGHKVATMETSDECVFEEALLIKNYTSLTNTTIIEATANDYDKFDWSEELQGFIISSSLIGFLLLHIPSGLLAFRYDGKLIILGSIICNAIGILSSTFVTQIGGAYGLITTRFLSGLAESAYIPAFGKLLAAWVPNQERSRIMTLALSGMQVKFLSKTICARHNKLLPVWFCSWICISWISLKCISKLANCFLFFWNCVSNLGNFLCKHIDFNLGNYFF